MLATHLGSFNTSSTRTHVRFLFSTHAAAGGNIAPLSAFEAADLTIYKATDGAAFSATQRTSSSGITMTSPFDSLTGFHAVDIDLTDNTDAGFYAAGSTYAVVLAPDTETIDSQTITGVVLAYFEIGPPPANVTQFGGTAGTFNSGIPDVRMADAVSHGGTLGSSTATLALSRLSVVSQSSNTAAVTATGNGTGSAATLTGGATGHGLNLIGGGTSGNALRCTNSGDDAVLITATGTSKHGVIITGGSAGTSDGLKLVAGSGGVGFRVDTITASGAVTLSSTLTVSGATTLTGAVSATNGSNDIRGVALAANQHVIVDSGTVTTVTNQLTAAQIATGVWQDTTAGDFTVASSIGKSLYTSGNAPGAASGLALVGSNMGTASSVTGNVGGNVVGSVASVTAPVTLTSAYDFAKGTTAMTESYNADGAAPTPAQALFVCLQMLTEKSITGTTLTMKKLDGTTTAATFTLNDASTPTSITRTT